MKTLRLILLISCMAWASIQCGTDEDSPNCPTATCNDYLTHEQAQTAFDADKNCMKDLDDDNDGIACEHLSSGGGGGTGCPTTSNCGCSNKTKSQCESTCCKWVVGTGCVCR